MYNLQDKLLAQLKGKRVMIFGMGKSNEYLIKFLSKEKINLVLCDTKQGAQIPSHILEYIKSTKTECRFGGNCTEKIDCDILIRTPGMSFNSDFILRARKAGVTVTSEMEMFFDICPCPIIGITGSDGKSTVTSIIYEMLKNAGKKVYKGGNLGEPFLARLDEMQSSDIVVAELSSFQLISMRKSPNIAVITNISPNHLDVHKNMEEYIAAKKNIFLHQGAFGRTILNYDNAYTREFSEETRGKVVFFSRKTELENGVWANQNGDIFVSEKGESKLILNRNDIKILGNHNLENYLAAIAAVWGIAGVNSIIKTAKEFPGIAHRMEKVTTLNSVDYYNDSIATTPTRVISGCLSLFSKKIILICGGYDKNIPFDELGDVINQKVKILVLMGQTAEKIENCIKKSKIYQDNEIKIFHAKDMEEAVKISAKNAQPNDIVVLSPACASFGMYKNFEKRGEHFKRVVNELKENKHD